MIEKKVDAGQDSDVLRHPNFPSTHLLGSAVAAATTSGAKLAISRFTPGIGGLRKSVLTRSVLFSTYGFGN